MRTFIYTSEMPVSAEKLFEWHKLPDAFQNLMPPWQKVEMIQPPVKLAPGEQVIFTIKGLIPITWIAEHVEYIEGRRFSDKQVKGPFAYWYHTHEMVPIDSTRCKLVDTIEWELPGGAWLSCILSPLVSLQLKKLFTYRHQATYNSLTASKLSEV